MKRVGIYARVSTEGQNIEMQISDLTNYAKSRNWSVYKIYADVGTGTNDSRERFREMMSDARMRKIDVIICWKLDRLFRSLKNLIITLQEFDELGIKFLSYKDSIDLTTASGRLLMQIIGSMAEFEASLIKERVMAGLENARRKGKTLGRPASEKCGEIIKLRQGGLSIRRIAEQLKISKSLVHKTLSKTGS